MELPPHHPGTVIDVVRMLKHLHALPVPTFPVGHLDPFRRLADRIAAARSLPDDDRAWLFDHLTSLEQGWAALPPGLPRCVVHGDAWGGNIAIAVTGNAYLLDLERCSIGPPEWDLVSTAVAVDTVRAVTTEEYTEFCSIYGVDVTAWSGYKTMRAIRELRMTSFVAQHAAAHREWQDHAHHRFDCIRGRAGPRPWTWKPLT